MRTASSLFLNAFSTAKRPTTLCAASLALALAMTIACGGSSKPETAAPTTDEPQPTAVTPDTGGDTAPAAAADPELVAKGAAVYEEYCGICHGDAGAGTKKSPAIKGAGSNEKFSSTDEVFEYTKKEMPKDDPGSLSDDEYKAVVAWMQS